MVREWHSPNHFVYSLKSQEKILGSLRFIILKITSLHIALGRFPYAFDM